MGETASVPPTDDATRRPSADSVEAEALRDLAIAVAREAGAVLVRGRDSVRTFVGTKTSGTDMVTEMDRASEALVTRLLLEARPDDAVVGEEGVDHPGTSGIGWVVDPLDGTTNYLYGYHGYAVSIAAVRDGIVLAGAVFDPVHNEMFAAALGHGATCDASALAINQPADLSTVLLGTGFSYVSTRRAEQATILARVLPKVRDIRRGGAAALDACWVGAGRLDAFFEHGLQPWDWAAGGLVASEAGARAEVLPGGLHLAAPPHLFDELRALVEE